MKKFFITIWDVIAILLLVVISQIIAGLQIPALTDNHIYTLIKTDFLAPLIYGALFYLGFIYLRKKLYTNTLVIHWPPKFRLRYFIYAFLLIMVIVIGWLFVGVRVVQPNLNQYLFLQNAISLVFADTLVAPFVEEITFRGVIFGQVAKQYNIKIGLGVSAVLFGLVHLLNGELNFLSAVQLVVSGTLMGLLLGVIYYYEKSIWANYTVHAIYNLFWGIFPVQQGITHDWPIQYIFSSKQQLLTGGQYGMDCSLPNIVGYLMMILLMCFLIRKTLQCNSLENEI